MRQVVGSLVDSSSRAEPRPSRGEAGDVAVEYVVLLGTIAIPLVPVLVAFGVWIVALFENLRNLALLPFP